ncbi:hypothetical protein VPLG_00120 [Vibrio phage eugene 12A10]|uniref:hypothetical protein n=1 Tax=Vibrio phage eugene 12A10 TaxID=573172 RepID=UPI0003515903|nr:hypothetical protein VPLG_00120 [Vibrio phage eugene 12A10]AGN51559.1 hypothetical protein VPLG_00120 [Vibrio phage eugene 12A10]
MNKVELAKMLGLEMVGYGSREVDHWEVAELTKFEYQIIEREFNSGITVAITQEDLDIIEIFEYIDGKSSQLTHLLWERAADQYLEKIKNLVETIKV